jgi:hypothetical protein
MTDELLIRVLTRLLRVHDELGDKAFEEAAHRSLVAIAVSVQTEAGRKAGLHDADLGEDVVPFPLGRTRLGRLPDDGAA